MQKYKWNADDYAKFSSQQQKWGRELIAKLNLKKNENVLDIGCGDGKVTAEISLTVPNGTVIGIDNSETMIKLAEKKFPEEIYSNLSFHLCDAENINFNDQFDVVFSNAALHWVDDHHEVLNGIYKSLKQGGRILLQFGGKGNAASAFIILDELMKDNEWLPYFRNFKFPYNFPGDEEYTALIKKSGFNIRRVELVEKEMIHEGEGGFAGWIRTTWLPYTSRIPEDKREEFIIAAVRKYIERFPPEEKGKIRIKMVRLEAEAVKE
jgi:trans-aconitate 2-methyltransferase